MEGFQKGHIYFASESVGEGHPDKLCDQISDAILDAAIRVNPDAKVAMETATKSGMVIKKRILNSVFLFQVVLLGETGVSKEQVNFEQIARQVCVEVGYNKAEVGLDGPNMNVIINVQAQSAEIANAVHTNKDESDFGAGDQGLMFGYATDEWDTKNLHPYSHWLANKICEELAS